MGCSYTGSAGGAIPTETTNCANEAAGMASIRSVSNNKRILCILNHLARSSFDLPGCTLLLRAAWSKRRRVKRHRQGLHGPAVRSEHYGSLSASSQSNQLNRTAEATSLVAKKSGASPESGPAPSRAKLVASQATADERYSVKLSAMLTPGYIGLHK